MVRRKNNKRIKKSNNGKLEKDNERYNKNVRNNSDGEDDCKKWGRKAQAKRVFCLREIVENLQ